MRRPLASFRVVASAIVALTIPAFFACGSSTTFVGPVGSGGDGGDASQARDDGGADGSSSPDLPIACTSPSNGTATCNAIVQTGSLVKSAAVVGSMPKGSGGFIVNGRYHTTAVTTYQGSTLNNLTVKQTWELCDGAWAIVGEESSNPEYRKSGHYSASGNLWTSDFDECTTQDPNFFITFTFYTATPTTLTLYIASDDASYTLTKE